LISKQLKDVVLALKSLNKRVNADNLYEEVMKVERYDEFMLASRADNFDTTRQPNTNTTRN
jgi:hypothetical protein